MVAALPLIQARLRPSVSTVRRNSRASSTGKPCSSSQGVSAGETSNSAAISQRVAPSRTTPLSARAPKANCRASIRMDLPAPVSPVNTEKPLPKSRSRDCTMTKSRKTMRLRLMNVGIQGRVLGCRPYCDRPFRPLRSSAVFCAGCRNSSSPPGAANAGRVLSGAPQCGRRASGW